MTEVTTVQIDYQKIHRDRLFKSWVENFMGEIHQGQKENKKRKHKNIY